MKYDLKNKIIFVAGCAFGLVMLGALTQFVGAYTWTPPTGTFPDGNVAPPVDTSGNPQEKFNTLTFSSTTIGIFLNNNVGISSPGSSLFLNASGNSVLTNNNGAFIVSATKGLKVPNIAGSAGALAEKGTIYFNTADSKLYFNNSGNASGWKEVGSGSAGGDTYWKSTNGGIIYEGGNALISGNLILDNTGAINTAKFWFTEITKIEGKQFSLVPVAHAELPGSPRQMGCDTSDYYRESTCDNYSGKFKDGTTPTSGDLGYDRFAECPDWNGLSGDLDQLSGTCKYYNETQEMNPTLQHTGQPTFKRANYVFETRVTGSTGNTTKISAGTFEGGIGNLDFAKVRTASAGGFGAFGSGGCTELKDTVTQQSVKGIVISTVVNTGGSGGEQTRFQIFDSLSLPANSGKGPTSPSDRGGNRYGGYTLADDQGNVSAGGNNIMVCMPSAPLSGLKQFIDSIQVKYIPVSF